MGLSRADNTYVLIHLDKFTRAVQLTAVDVVTTIYAARTTLRWVTRNGIPKWIISDGGSNFKNEKLEVLAGVLGFEHHITLAYCPWTNDSIEVVVKDLVWTVIPYPSKRIEVQFG